MMEQKVSKLDQLQKMQQNVEVNTQKTQKALKTFQLPLQQYIQFLTHNQQLLLQKQQLTQQEQRSLQQVQQFLQLPPIEQQKNLQQRLLLEQDILQNELQSQQHLAQLIMLIKNLRHLTELASQLSFSGQELVPTPLTNISPEGSESDTELDMEII